MSFLANPCNGYCQNSQRCTVDCTDSSCDTPNCTCMNGFTGDRCETVNPDACQSNPCVHGLCIPTATNDFQCQCNNSYIGSRCDKRKNEKHMRKTDLNVLLFSS